MSATESGQWIRPIWKMAAKEVLARRSVDERGIYCHTTTTITTALQLCIVV